MNSMIMKRQLMTRNYVMDATHHISYQNTLQRATCLVVYQIQMTMRDDRGYFEILKSSV